MVSRGWWQVNQCCQGVNVSLLQLLELALAQTIGNDQAAKAYSLQAADGEVLRLPQTAHLAVTTLKYTDVEPVVNAGATGVNDVGEAGHAIFKLHTVEKIFYFLLSDLAHHAHGIFALNGVGRVHQAAGQLTVVGEQQQAGGVQIQSADGNPALAFEPWQLIEYRRAAFFVHTAADFAFRLVISNHPAHTRSVGIQFDDATVHGDDVGQGCAIAQAGFATVDADAAIGDPALHLTA